MSTADEDPQEPSLEVRAVDENRNPVAGVGVELEMRIVGGSGGNKLGEGISRAGDGVVHIGLEKLQMEPERARLIRSMNPYFVVRALHAQRAPAMARLEAEPADGDSVKLVVEAGGALEVTVLTADGGAPPEGTTMFSWWSTPEEVERDSSKRGSGDGMTRVPVVDGIARIEDVGPGLVFTLSPRAEGLQPSHSDWIPGPVQADETAYATVRLGPELATLRGRLLGADGAPLANERQGLLSTIPALARRP